jgi:SH3 domain-containing YSC84-like protein 1
MKISQLALFGLSAGLLIGAPDARERLDAAADTMSEIMSAPDKGIPQDLLRKSECLVVVPGVKKAAFIVGAKLCRKAGGGWSAPAAIRVEGGSVGFQIGGSDTDVVLLVMNKGGVKKLLQSKFTIGADANAAIGPVGRDSSAETDAQMHAEILTYSRSRGLFAGVSLQGATLRPDEDWNNELYGKPISNRDIVLGDTPVPQPATRLINVLDKYSSRRG